MTGTHSGLPVTPFPSIPRYWRFRHLAAFWAFILGYFWSACPKCGRMFAGFEIGGSLDFEEEKGSPGCIRVTVTRGLCVCSKCAATARDELRTSIALAKEEALS